MKRSVLIWSLLLLSLCFLTVACSDPAEDGYGSASDEDGDDADDDDENDDDDDDDDNDDGEEYQEMELPTGAIFGTVTTPEPENDDGRNFNEMQLYLLTELPEEGSLPEPVNHDTLQNFASNDDETLRIFSFDFPYLDDGSYYLYVWIDLNGSHEVEDGETFLYGEGIVVEERQEKEVPQWDLPIEM